MWYISGWNLSFKVWLQPLVNEGTIKLRILHPGVRGSMLSCGIDLLKSLSMQGWVWSHSSDIGRWTPTTVQIHAACRRDDKWGSTFARCLLMTWHVAEISSSGSVLEHTVRLLSVFCWRVGSVLWTAGCAILSAWCYTWVTNFCWESGLTSHQGEMAGLGL